MKAEVGDQVVIEGPREGAARRDGEIIALHDPAGEPPYEVRWSDTGHVSVFYPGPDAHVVHLHQPRSAPAPAVADPDARAVVWTAKLVFEEDGDHTRVHLLVDTGKEMLESEGTARRLVHDEPSASIGEKFAAGRALIHLGDDLLRRAAVDSASENPTQGA